ncbi:MAG: orotidine-5'-phosphate decarboxylase [Rhodospirillales bacterium CG15_BIG_FIL_POST_REV_8_21_14_020_66_15]|nr:MAG: orotidine-5'-phosphate decarboxylase [Rhodospirillales bacterium CG15_BIG_FIL_POST_REV_8_21_14_020_66_15]
MTASTHAPGITRPADRILVALDTTDADRALALAEGVKGAVGGVKLGKEFFTAQGPEGVRKVSAVGLPVFLDLKFHDIPNTVAGAVRAAAPLKPFMLNVHASGGRAMMEAAVRAADEAAAATGHRPLLLAVTVLTSLSDEDLIEVGITAETKAQVARLAKLAQQAGMDGVVCSAHEIKVIRSVCGPDFTLVVPGIRPEWSVKGDQKRVVTPRDAVSLGADYLVIGRPVTQAEDPIKAAGRIAAELSA